MGNKKKEDPSGKAKGQPKKLKKPSLSWDQVMFRHHRHVIMLVVILIMLVTKVVIKRRTTIKRPKEYINENEAGLDDICPINLYSMNVVDVNEVFTGGKFIRPQNQLRPSKLLIPLLGYGRSNQIRSLMESMIVALYLNRTLVLPPFYSDAWQDTNEQLDIDLNENFDAGTFAPENSVLEPYTQLDITKLRSFMRVTSWQDAVSKCNHHFNTIFVGHSNYCQRQKYFRMKAFSEYTTFTCIKPTVKHEPAKDRRCEILDDKGATILPNNILYSTEFQHRMNMPFDAEKVKTVFSDDKMCAFYVYPSGIFDFSLLFRDNEHFLKSGLGVSEATDTEKTDSQHSDYQEDEFLDTFEGFQLNEKGFNDANRRAANFNERQLLNSVLDAVKRPPFITKLYNLFKEKVIGKVEFLSVDFTFTDRQFDLASYNKEYIKSKMHLGRFDIIRLSVRVNDIRKSRDYMDLLSMLVKKVKALNQKLVEQDFPLLKSIYLTSQNEEDRQRIEDLKKKISMYNNKFQILSREDIREFLNGEMSWCSIYQEKQDNIIDMIEHELSIDASVFGRSPGSDWSYLVQMERLVSIVKKEMDFSVIDLLLHLLDFSTEFKEARTTTEPPPPKPYGLPEGELAPLHLENFVNNSLGLVQAPNSDTTNIDDNDYAEHTFKFKETDREVNETNLLARVHDDHNDLMVDSSIAGSS